MQEFRVTDQDGKQINQGDPVTDFRGDVATFEEVTRGTEYNGTAKVLVTWPDGTRREYYAQVFELTVERLSQPFTVAISGSERHDGEKPYWWVVEAPDMATAKAMAMNHHNQMVNDDLSPDDEWYDGDLIVVDGQCHAGIPDCPPDTLGYVWNDLRGDDSDRLLAEFQRDAARV